MERFGTHDIEGLRTIPDLWYTAWMKFHHDVYSLAYALNPEYHRTKPWEDESVKTDIDRMLKR
jgi:hypothetical protein